MAVDNLGEDILSHLSIEVLSTNTTTQCRDSYSYGSIPPDDNLWGEEDYHRLVDFSNVYDTPYQSIVNDVTNC